MMTLEEWANKWGLPERALDELCDIQSYVKPSDTDKSERAVQSLVRMEAARKGIYLFRNNVGAGTLDNGSFLRWGLANDSPALNKITKSADLIGIAPRVILPSQVGQTVGVFVSREVKRARGGVTSPAQIHWATLINRLGGDAKIVNGPGSFDGL